MNAGRWYPAAITLANGDILVVSGSEDTTVGGNPLPEVFQAGSHTWRALTGAQLQQPYYPYMFLAPNGKVFNAGPSATTRYLDTSGTGAWSVVGNNTFGTRNWGSAAMYAPGRVLYRRRHQRGVLWERIRRCSDEDRGDHRPHGQLACLEGDGVDEFLRAQAPQPDDPARRAGARDRRQQRERGYERELERPGPGGRNLGPGDRSGVDEDGEQYRL